MSSALYSSLVPRCGVPLRSVTRTFVTTCCLALSAAVICQTKPTNTPSRITATELAQVPLVDSSAVFKSIPLTYFPKGSSYSDTIIVSSVIREQSSAGFYCGVICHSGTIRIEVDRIEQGTFEGLTLHVLIPCFVHRDEDIGRRIDLTLTPLPADRDIGCFSAVWNTIDSHGLPFYFSEEDRIDLE